MNLNLENIKLKAEHALLTEASNGNMSELELLEAKMELNSALMAIQDYMTEGTVEKVKKHLKKNWKKYALGAAAIGAAGAGYKYRDEIKDAAGKAYDKAGEVVNDVDNKLGGYGKAISGAVKEQKVQNDLENVSSRMSKEEDAINAEKSLTKAQKEDAINKMRKAEKEELLKIRKS